MRLRGIRFLRNYGISAIKAPPISPGTISSNSFRSASSTSLRPLQARRLSPHPQCRGIREQSAIAAASYVCNGGKQNEADLYGTEQTKQTAETGISPQPTPIYNLTLKEAERLSRVRNIGIAVSMQILPMNNPY